MFRRLLFLIPVFLLLSSLVTVSKAATSASTFIVLRCTATISVEIFSRPAGNGLPFDTTDQYNFGEVSAASTYYALMPIGVRNNSQGAITKWELDIPSVSNNPSGGEWTIGSSPGLNRAVVYAKFSTRTITADDYDVVYDTVPYYTQGAKRYELVGGGGNGSGSKFYDQISSYIEPSFTTDCSRVLPVTYDSSPNGKAERHMWIKVLTPTAVENAGAQTTITLRITAY